jgi:hypothetical protein
MTELASIEANPELWNPVPWEDEDDEELLVLESEPKPRQRRNPAKAEAQTGSLLILALLGFGGWLLWYWTKYGHLPWQTALSRKALEARVQASKNPNVPNVSLSGHKVISPAPSPEKETVSIISV